MGYERGNCPTCHERTRIGKQDAGIRICVMCRTKWYDPQPAVIMEKSNLSTLEIEVLKVANQNPGKEDLCKSLSQ